MRSFNSHSCNRARTDADRQRAIGLAERNLESENRRLILALEGDEMSARIENSSPDRLEAKLRGLLKMIAMIRFASASVVPNIGFSLLRYQYDIQSAQASPACMSFRVFD